MNKKRFIKYILLDFLMALFLIFIFLLYFYILPRKGDNAGRNIVSNESAEKQTFELPQSQGQASPKKGKPGRNNGNTNTKSIASENSDFMFTDKTDTVLEECKDNSLQLNIIKSELGEGNDKITYYTADICLSSTGQLKTAFAQDSFGKNLRETTLQMAKDHNALLAISGDSYGNNETGIVIRNGILYRSKTNDGEICVLFLDGTMKIYTPEEFDQEQIMESDVWQAWNFGPSLLNQGKVRDSFQTTSYLNNKNPRCAIGYIAPGHYKFVLVDGRNPGYSKGATMSELAQIMAYEGCILAYNLDGGKSSAMVYEGNYVNQPADGGRSISDIIYIGKETSSQ